MNIQTSQGKVTSFIVTFKEMAYPFWLDVTLDAGKFCPPALGVGGKKDEHEAVVKERGCCYYLPKIYMKYF